jgi:hypothetical protein
MVDEPGSIEHGEDPSLARPTSQALPAANITASQWEFPSLPRSLDFGDGSVDLSLSSWTDVGDPSTKHSSQLPPSGASSKGPSTDTHLTPDDLMTVWGRVGVQICEVATTLYEKSRKSLVGDGSYKGYVDAVLSQVPNAVLPSPPSYGYLIYVQVGSSVQKRASEIMPGDIVVIFDARFKGHKGIQTYHQNVGADVPLMGIVNEFEPKKSKIKVFEANQHVGQQASKNLSRLLLYRLRPAN